MIVSASNLHLYFNNDFPIRIYCSVSILIMQSCVQGFLDMLSPNLATALDRAGEILDHSTTMYLPLVLELHRNVMVYLQGSPFLGSVSMCLCLLIFGFHLPCPGCTVSNIDHFLSSTMWCRSPPSNRT